MEVYVYKTTDDVVNPVTTTTMIRTSHSGARDTDIMYSIPTLSSIHDSPTDYEQLI